MTNIIVIEVFVSLLTSNRSEAELFELKMRVSNTYASPEDLVSIDTLLGDQNWKDDILERLLGFNMDRVTFASPGHRVLVCIILARINIIFTYIKDLLNNCQEVIQFLSPRSL